MQEVPHLVRRCAHEANVILTISRHIPYSSKFLWHNIFVNFMIDPNFFSNENLILGGVAFSRVERVMY